MYNTLNYKLVTKEDLTYLCFTTWEKDERLIHAFSTRFGGVSEGMFNSLNLGFNRGDNEENVLENYGRMAKALEVPVESFVLSKQVHEINIAKVTVEDRGNGLSKPNQWVSMDGLYTEEKGVTLVTHYADCVPLFFYAPERGMIGMAHAGWRGTVMEIGKAMVKRWVEEEKIPLTEIQVAIGPSIGPCCFEVHEDVQSEFAKRFGEAADFITYDAQKQKYHIDLWACNRQSLLDAGILEENLIVSGICTCCHSELFFSHRKTAGKRGTLGAFMSLR